MGHIRELVLRHVGAFGILCGLLVAAPARAQGIPVIDIAGLVQAIQEVLQSLEQIENQVRQIKQLDHEINTLDTQVEAMTGVRDLGAILNNRQILNYVAPEAADIVASIDVNGYSALSGTAKSLRDARLIYNCMDRNGAQRTACQAGLAQPYQSMAFMQDAMNTARARLDQVQGLMQEINLTDDPKSVAEIQARITAENALIQHVSTQISMAHGMSDAERRVEESRAREAQMQQASRTGRLADFVPR